MYLYLIFGTTRYFKFWTKIQLCTNLYNPKLGTTMYTIVQLKYWYNYMLINLAHFNCLPHLNAHYVLNMIVLPSFV